MSKLFLYYSHTGNGDVVAERIKSMGIDTYKVVRAKPLPKSFFCSVMTGGFLAGINHKDKLQPIECDYSKYEEIIIGSPIWNARFACPINTLIERLRDTDITLSFVLYSGSGEAPKATKRIEKEFANSKYVMLKEPKNNPRELDKLGVLL